MYPHMHNLFLFTDTYYNTNNVSTQDNIDLRMLCCGNNMYHFDPRYDSKYKYYVLNIFVGNIFI